MLDSARQYLAAGFSVIPCRPGDKHPALTAWQRYQQHRPTDAELVSWFGNGQASNLGIVTGVVSGLVVLDVDGIEGQNSIQGRELPRTACARTSRGIHYYFRHPGHPVRNFVGRLAGLDLRGDGGCVVAPPSRHASGDVYHWEVPLSAGLAELPIWLAELLDNPRPGPKRDASPGWLARTLQGVSQGQRNDSAIRVAGYLRRHGVDNGAILAMLRAWNQLNRPPLNDAELTRVVASASRMEGPERGVELFTLGQLRNITSGVAWEWLNWIPKGAITTLVSRPGVGKTLLACALACAKVQGGRWPDNTQATQGRVLYLDAEAGAGELGEKFAYVGLSGDHSDLALAYGAHGGFLCADVDWAGIEEAWLSFGPDLVVVDPLTGHHRRDASSGPAMRSFYARLMGLAQQTSAAVVVLHHLRKRSLLDGEEIDLDRVRDSSDITAASRSVLALQEMESGDLKLVSLKSNFASKPEPLRIRKGADGLMYLGEIEDRDTKTEVEKAAAWLAVLLAGGPKRAKEVELLAVEKGIPERTLRRAKSQADIDSRRTAEGWIWRLPGTEAASENTSM